MKYEIMKNNANMYDVVRDDGKTRRCIHTAKTIKECKEAIADDKKYNTIRSPGRPQNPHGPRQSLTISLPLVLREKLDRLGEKLTRETGEAHGTSRTIQQLIDEAAL